MTIKTLIASSGLMLLFAACNNEPKQAEAPKMDSVKNVVATEPKKEENPFKDVKFDEKTDLACGMPITAGVEDTAHYKEKIYGFCSKECKEAFVKDPNQYLTIK
jgi:YHS domain-containing protein